MRDERLEKLAEVLVSYSTKVKAGDDVCVSGEEASLPFIKEVSKKVIEKGAFVRYFVDLPQIEAFLLKNGSEEQIGKPNFRFGECARSDVWISAWGTDNICTLNSISGERLKMRRLGNSENRKVYNSRSGSGALRWCGTQYPTNADAQYAKMSLEEYEDFVYKAGFLDRSNPVEEWKKLEKFQQKWIEYLDKKEVLHIVSADTDIEVGIKGRKWINCCGKENFPDGEIFTSPVEDMINGRITFSYPALINGNAFAGVSLLVREGRIVKAHCKDRAQEEKLLSYIDTDEGSRYFGEVAIGTNYDIDRFSYNILFDEKMGGTMHMAVGCAMEEAGGKNESAIHWDMINDMKTEGRIYADGELFYEKGRFLDTVLK